MKFSSLLLVLLYSLQLSASPLASASDSLLFKKADTTRFALQQKQQWEKQKWSIKNRRILTGSATTLATAGLIAASYEWVDKPLHKFSQEYRTEQSTTNTISKLVQPLGTTVPIHATAGALLLAGMITKRPKLKDAAAVTLGSFYLNAGVTGILKNQFQRHRPSSTNNNELFEGPSGDGTNSSMPSGHTSTAFAAATSIASVYHDSPWVPKVAYGVATLVGLSRINDNKHWASDVLAGAALGYLSGKITFWGYQRLKQGLSKKQFTVRPGWDKQPTLAASLRF